MGEVDVASTSIVVEGRSARVEEELVVLNLSIVLQ